MKIVLLSPYPEKVAGIFKHDTLITQSHNGPIPECDFVVSFGHRHIIKDRPLDLYKGRIINVHAGYLPYTRGAHPNFWSWFEGTPHGVTVHHVDSGLDTGDIIFRHYIKFLHPEKETLESSYKHLEQHAIRLLGETWTLIKAGDKLPRCRQDIGGSYHRAKDMDGIVLPAGWATPVQYVVEMGERYRAADEAV